MKINVETSPALQAAIEADRAACKPYPYRPVMYDGPLPLNVFRQIIGGDKWVLARRSPYIVNRYGEDVICLSQQRYSEVERLARLLLTEGYD